MMIYNSQMNLTRLRMFPPGRVFKDIVVCAHSEQVPGIHMKNFPGIMHEYSSFKISNAQNVVYAGDQKKKVTLWR
jgi:hypothetical protein